MKLKLSIIGCGRLGKVLAALLLRTKRVCIQDVLNLTYSSSKKAVAFIGQGNVCQTLRQLQAADIYLIATPDDCIEFIAQQLMLQRKLKQDDVIFHCSGLLSSESLNTVTRLGCYIASLHPLYSFSNPVVDIKKFKGTYCAFEGDKAALDRLLPLIKAIGGRLFKIEKKAKPLYHVASVLASNYLVTLSAIAGDCYLKAGLDSELSVKLTQQLMSQTLTKVRQLKPKKALTGPLERADINTLKKHLVVLNNFPELGGIYKSLGKATLGLTKHKKPLKTSLTALLS